MKWKKALFFAIRQTFVVVMWHVPLSKSYTVCEQACRVLVLYDFVFIYIYLPVIYLLHFYQTKMKKLCNFIYNIMILISLLCFLHISK